MKTMFGNITHGMAADLEFRMLRHNMLSANLANLDTPGFVAQDLKFDRVVQSVFEGESMDSRNGSTPGVSAQTVVVPGTPGADGNKADMEKNMGLMSENALKYQSTAKFLNRHLSMLKYAINQR